MASSLEVRINPSTPQPHATHLSLSTSLSSSLLIPSGCHDGNVSASSHIPLEFNNDYASVGLLVPSQCKHGGTSMDLMIPSNCSNGQITRPRCQHPGRRLIGTRVYDSILGVTCHWCRQKTVEDHVRCCECTVTFCGGCLKNRHGEFVHIEMQDDVDWVCPKCRGGCGDGCNNCCNCGPCRRAQGLEPTGLLVHTARAHGFNNVHDYLIHRITGESPEIIAERKRGKAWCQTSELSLTERLKLEDEHVERMKCVKSAAEIGLRKRPSFTLSDSRRQNISTTKDSKLHPGSFFENDKYAIMPYDRYAIFPYAVPLPANIVPAQGNFLGLNTQYRPAPMQFQEMGIPYPITFVPYAPHVHVDSYRWHWQFVHVKEEPVECSRPESPPEEKGFICTKILKGEQLEKLKNVPDQSPEAKEKLLREAKKDVEACWNRPSESLKDSSQVCQPNIFLVPHNDCQTALSMVSSDLGKHPSTGHLKVRKGSPICNLQEKKIKHQIADLNLNGNIVREQTTLHVFESAYGGESVTGVLQHREVDLTRYPNRSLDIKNTCLSRMLESTVALSGSRVLQNVKVKEECEDPIILSHFDSARDKVFASHQLDENIQGFVINKDNDDHSTNIYEVREHGLFSTVIQWLDLHIHVKTKVPDGKKKMVVKSGFKSKLAARLSEPFCIDELEILTRAFSHKQPFYKSCEDAAGYARFISKTELSCLNYHSELASQLQSSSSPEFKLSLLRGFFFWLEHAKFEDSFKPWAEQMSSISANAAF